MSAGERTGTQAGALLMRALVADAAAAGCIVAPVSIETRDWASVTFIGAQHWIAIVVTGDGAMTWLATLPEADLAMRGHVLGDIVVDAVVEASEARAVAIAALTLVDAR